jgi:alkylhydroperoxidase family enzyme
MSSILPATSADPVGAVALLECGDPLELERFVALENAMWQETTLAPAVVETVRLHCAQVRGCEFCKAVRYTAAIDDGLTETQIAQLDMQAAREEFSAEQSAALALADHFLRDPRKPDSAAQIAETLGTAGVMEVLIGCCAFASAELRIALGENREPHGSGVIDRAAGGPASFSKDTAWPVLNGPVLSTDTTLPAVAPGLASPIQERVFSLWSGRDLAPELVAACIVRSAQLLGVAPDDPVNNFLVPPEAARIANADDVRGWPSWTLEQGRNEMALAEQLWIDPAGVDGSITEPLVSTLGVDGLIRAAWNLILIGQLHRLALTLHREK